MEFYDFQNFLAVKTFNSNSYPRLKDFQFLLYSANLEKVVLLIL